MGAYSYQALDAKGKTVKGVLEGDSERHVRSVLRSRQLKPLEVRSTQKKADQQEKSGVRLNLGAPRVGYRDISLVTRQLASLVQSGLPIDEVLRSTAAQSRKPAIKALLLQVRSRVLEGLTLAQAMSEAPRAFDSLYRAMVRAGESAGFLGPVLEQLADYTERTQETKQKLRMAMVYPVIMAVVSLSVIIVLMALVVPKMVSLFEQNQQALPLLTRGLITVSDFIVNYGAFVLAGIVLLILGFIRLLRAPERRQRWHRFLLRLPVFGSFVLQGETARYASTLGLLVTSGVPLLEALRIASQVISNTEMKQASTAVALAVQEGSSLHRALDQTNAFPPLLVQMAASGEANGKLAEQLLHAARNQERELEFSVGTVMALMEPLMIVFMGGAVTLIVLAILLPIFRMNTLIG